jgi:hypothetical protein
MSDCLTTIMISACAAGGLGFAACVATPVAAQELPEILSALPKNQVVALTEAEQRAITGTWLAAINTATGRVYSIDTPDNTVANLAYVKFGSIIIITNDPVGLRIFPAASGGVQISEGDQSVAIPPTTTTPVGLRIFPAASGGVQISEGSQSVTIGY